MLISLPTRLILIFVQQIIAQHLIQNPHFYRWNPITTLSADNMWKTGLIGFKTSIVFDLVIILQLLIVGLILTACSVQERNVVRLTKVLRFLNPNPIIQDLNRSFPLFEKLESFHSWLSTLIDFELLN